MREGMRMGLANLSSPSRCPADASGRAFVLNGGLARRAGPAGGYLCSRAPAAPWLIYCGFERVPDETLIGGARAFGCGLYCVEEQPWQTQVDSRAFGLELEPDRSHPGQVIVAEVGGGDELLSLGVGS